MRHHRGKKSAEYQKKVTHQELINKIKYEEPMYRRESNLDFSYNMEGDYET